MIEFVEDLVNKYMENLWSSHVGISGSSSIYIKIPFQYNSTFFAEIPS